MLRSSAEMLGLVAELNVRRISLVMNAWAAACGGPPQLNEYISLRLLTARELHHRFLRGEYQHTEVEQGLVVELCNWLIEKHAELNGQALAKRQHDWLVPNSLWSKREQPIGMYAEAIAKVSMGWQ